MFIYGGCGGNRNNFETIEECRDSCVGKLTILILTLRENIGCECHLINRGLQLTPLLSIVSPFHPAHSVEKLMHQFQVEYVLRS